MDYVHTDDVIIPASARVGFDCIDGEDFGWDTLRLEENVLRIDFTDSSYASGFPTQDWTLVANDREDGGANYFAIRADSPSSSTPFKIEAGAPTSSFHIADTGNIGIGTSVPHPNNNMHILDNFISSIRLERTAGDFSAQTWDLMNWGNVALFDSTNGGLPFQVVPGADDWSLYVEHNSNIGMGTSGPDSPLNIQTGADMVTPQPDTVLHLENDDEEGYGTDLTITAARDKSSRIYFARPGDPDAGGIYYSHTTDNFTFVAAGATRMQLGPGVGTLPEVEVFGDMSITGSLSKGGGGFKIDHPLEPDKKFLSPLLCRESGHEERVRRQR